MFKPSLPHFFSPIESPPKTTLDFIISVASIQLPAKSLDSSAFGMPVDHSPCDLGSRPKFIWDVRDIMVISWDMGIISGAIHLSGTNDQWGCFFLPTIRGDRMGIYRCFSDISHFLFHLVSSGNVWYVWVHLAINFSLKMVKDRMVPKVVPNHWDMSGEQPLALQVRRRTRLLERFRKVVRGSGNFTSLPSKTKGFREGISH